MYTSQHINAGFVCNEICTVDAVKCMYRIHPNKRPGRLAKSF